ncbi:MAG: PVC-type heme-binding CxxCH protein [Isosphaeraceae bacterium]
MTVAGGLEARLVASEPLVRQPVAIEFDDRGRLWVIQYLQYPNPSGLNRVKVDRYSRTVYDRIPEPPPRGPRGEDRVTILEDTDGDGLADRSLDFASGLNLASGLAFGYGGVFILQPPYLLFYADRDRDDRPDGDPEVLLTGFGMEDAHSVANSLTWGPDGWLYGLQGSTVTARIRGVEFQQGVWRYHPTTRRFELFCEGGGNMWGLDFDRRGQLFASTNVGGFVALHAVQGGYYWKSFGKHGPLHNPYTYGYFDHVRHEGVRGGHVAVGGLFYEADAWPTGWRGRYIAADLLGHAVHWHELTRDGSTFRGRQRGDVVQANDTWFAPSDQTLGPDGALYVTDWHDRRTAHPDPDADWDRSNGRIVAIQAPGAPAAGKFDLAASPNEALLGLLRHPNHWYRRRARRLLAERHDATVARGLRDAALKEQGPSALEALWAAYGCGGMDETWARALLESGDEDVRAWAVRLIGDEPSLSSSLGPGLVLLAARDPGAIVRAQLASTARRVGSGVGLGIAEQLLLRDLDAGDPHIPLLTWWAIEHHALVDRDSTLRRFTSPSIWRSRLFRAEVAGRLMRRFAAERNPGGDEACRRLLASAPSEPDRRLLVGSLDEETQGRPPSGFAPGLVRSVIALAESNRKDSSLTRLAARLGDGASRSRAWRMITDPTASEHDRLAMLKLAGELRDGDALGGLLKLVAGDAPERFPASLRSAAFEDLAQFDDERIAATVLRAYPSRDEDWRSRTRELLLGRASWARAYLREIDRGALPAADVSLDQIRRYAVLRDPSLEPLVRKHWGMTRGPTTEERLAEIRRLNNDLNAGPGDPARGRKLFGDRCATCHRLGDQGEAVGPDLTFANRQDREFLLTSLVDPGVVVRKEYQLYQLATRDGRVLSGLIADQTPTSITLLTAKGERTSVPRSEVEELKESEGSLMPDSLYKELRPEELRDLFRYLQAVRPEGQKETR